MSRRSRLHVPGGVYYVVQRSNARQPIFTEEADYATFERLLSTMLVRCRVRAHAYCWETDAIHLVLQISDMPVGRLMQRLSSQYARRVHRRAGELGHLFQQRYHALLIDTVTCTLGLERSEVLSRSRQRRLALARALITWYATERGVATLAEVARRLQRDPSTLFVAVERYRTLRPELFNLTALQDSG